MCGSMADIQSAAADIRRGKKKERNHRAKISFPHLLCRAAINSRLSTARLILNCRTSPISALAEYS